MGCISRDCLCIFCIFFLVFFAVPFTIVTTLYYVGVEPRFYLEDLFIPALNNSHTSNNSIFIDIKLKRVVAYVPLRYEDLNVTLFYASNRSFSIANYIVPGFYQGTKKTVHRRAVVEARGLHPISAGSTVALAVELATKYKLKRFDDDGGWHYDEPKEVVVAAHLQLDASGRKLSKKPLRLH